jgi:hypothetical protein
MKFPLKFLSTSSGLTNKLGLLSLHAQFNSALTPTECMLFLHKNLIYRYTPILSRGYSGF